MKKSYLIGLISLIILSSCGVYNKDSYLKSFESFLVDLEKKETLKEKELDEITVQYEEYSKTYYNKYKDELTSADRKKIGVFKTRYLKVLTIHHVNRAGKTLKELQKEVSGFFRGVDKIRNQEL